MILGIAVSVFVGIITMNPIAGFGAFIATIFLEIFVVDHIDDLLV